MYGGRSKKQKSKTQKQNLRKLKEWTRLLRKKTKPMYGKTHAEKLKHRHNILVKLKDKTPYFKKGSKMYNKMQQYQRDYTDADRTVTNADGSKKQVLSFLWQNHGTKKKKGIASKERHNKRQLGVKTNKYGDKVATRKSAQYRQKHGIPINNR